MVLLAWMAPAVGALGVSLHLTLDHHGSPGGEPPAAITELARTAAHGHHHDLAAERDHGHEARVEELAPALRPPVATVAVLPTLAVVEATPTERPYRVGSLRSVPPDPLFTLHCSLLL